VVWLLGSYAALSLVTTVAQWLGLPVVAEVAYVVLMPLLVGFVVVTTRRRTRLVILTVVALGWSWLGDWADQVLLVKIIFFLLAQIAYTTAFWPTRHHSLLGRPVPLTAYGVVLGSLIVALASRAGSLAPPVAVYGVGLGVMGILATGVNQMVGVGAFLFLLSDIVLGVHLFVGPDAIPAGLAVNSACYLLGQLLIAVGVIRHAATHPVRERPLFASTGG